MTIAKTVKIKETNKTAITAVNAYYSPNFVDGMFNSCRDVQMPSSNSPVLDVLCGTTADKCTPQGWLTYMGSTSNGQAPFDIHFNVTNVHIHIPNKSKH